MLRSTTGRRISLLASSSLAASTLAAGLGGVAFTAFTPAVALAACNPTAAGTTSGAATNAKGLQTCGGTDAGVFYKATAGLTVLFVGEKVTTNGFGATATGTTGVKIGVDTTTLTAGNIVSTTGAGIGISLGSGSIEVDTGSTIGPNPAALVTGKTGIAASTGGAGTVLINAMNTVTGTATGGIVVNAGVGNVTINAMTNSGGNVTVSGVTGAGIGVSGGGNVTITAPGNVTTVTGDAISATGVATNVTINSGFASSVTGDGIHVSTLVNFSSNQIHVNSGGVTTLTGDGINVFNGGDGTNTINVNGNVSTLTGVGVSSTTFSAGIGGPGTNNVNLANGVKVSSVTGDGIDMAQTLFVGDGNLKFGVGASVSTVTGDGVSMSGAGSGNLNITQTTADRTASISTVTGIGLLATEGASATGNINVNFQGNITATAGPGVEAVTFNGAATDHINLTLGNVSAGGTGVFAQNNGHGDINITTIPNSNVSSSTSDGIDAFALGGGNVTINLLDGSVSANTSSATAPIGPTSPIILTGGAAPLGSDPIGVHAVAVAGGTVTINQNSFVTNKGPGDGILSQTVNGKNTVNVNANVTTALGTAVAAVTSGLGNVSIDVFKEGTGLLGQTQNNVTITTTGGSGLLASNTDTGLGAVTAQVITAGGGPGNLTVKVTGAGFGSVGVGARIATQDTTSHGLANVNLSNAAAGSSINVQGAGSNVGVEAVATTTDVVTGFAGGATVTIGNGLGVTVGTTSGGNKDIGVLASSQDGADPVPISVTLGNSNTVTVGKAGSTGAVGIAAEGLTVSPFAGDSVSITAGNNNTVTVTGGGADGVFATVSNGKAFGNPGAINVSIGNGGSITVHDTAGNPGVGVLANDHVTHAGANVSVSVGTTSVTVDHGSGIEAFAVGANSASASSNGNVTVGNIGVAASSVTGNVTALYNNTGSASATMNYGGQFGVAAITGGKGNATVLVGNGIGTTTIHSTNTGIISFGVVAEANGSGNANITSSGKVTVDPTAIAQIALSGSGTASVVTGLGDSNSVIDPAGVSPVHIGLLALSGQAAGASSARVTIAGSNTVSVTGLTGNMDGSVGVAALDAAGGDVVVNTLGTGNALSITVGGNNSAGIVASTVGSNGATPAPLIFTPGLALGTSAGNVTVSTGTGLIKVGGVDTHVGGDNSGEFAQAYGIYTASDGGNISVKTNASIIVSNGAGLTTAGIFAETDGAGNIVIGAPFGQGQLITSNAGTGIFALNAGGGGGNVTVGSFALGSNGPINAGINASGDGIIAENAGLGHTLVTTGGSSTINAGLNGIFATAGSGGKAVGTTTTVTVIADGSVNANSRGIVTVSGNNATISIGPDGTFPFVLGGGGAGSPAVDVFAPVGATTTINNVTGFVGSQTSFFGNFVTGLGQLAIRGSTGSVVINNGPDGFIAGRMNFAGLSGTSSVTLNNTGFGEWFTNGVSTFSPGGKNTINNTGDARIVASADQVATTWVFGTGVNKINNTGSGTIIIGDDISKVGSGAAPAVLTIAGTVTLTNDSLIIMGAHDNNLFVSDRVINSVLEAPNTTLTGTGVIALDANLWSDTQSKAACTTAVLTAADCLVVAATGGNEGIRVADTRAHAFGAFNPGGIVIVSGASSGANFHLDGGSDFFNLGGTNEFGGAGPVIDKPGFFFYTLAFDAPNHDELIIGVPKESAFEFASVGGAVDDIWYQTTQNWFDRQADLRDTLGSHASGHAPGVWLKALGDWVGHDSAPAKLTLFDQTFTFKVGYDQNTAGLIGGVDLLNVQQKDQAWVAGLEGGWVDSDVNFRHSPDRYHLTGEDFGGYVTYLSGGLFVDGTVNANFLRIVGNLPDSGAGPGPLLTSGHATSVGGQVEAGYTMSLGPMIFWEPLGTLAYVSTSFDNFAVPGGTVKLTHTDSFRGALGARIGLNQDFQYYRVKFALTGRVWDEFNENATSDLVVAGGPDFFNHDDFKGVFGQLQGEANIFANKSGLSAFLNGGVKFRDHYSDTNVTLGARYQW